MKSLNNYVFPKELTSKNWTLICKDGATHFHSRYIITSCFQTQKKNNNKQQTNKTPQK